MKANEVSIHSLFVRKARGRLSLYMCASLLALLALMTDCDGLIDEFPTPATKQTPIAEPPTHPPPPAIEIGDARFDVEVVSTPKDRFAGLSNRDSLAPMTGMLFVFERPHVATFWMREMRFPLDFVWIGEGCTVVDITPDVPNPPPDTPSSNLPMYAPSGPILYTLELNAGEAEQHGIAEGDRVRFRGVSAEEMGDGC